MQSTSTSLRERQRETTWQCIHEAAASLVLEAGLAAATVDAIVDRAGCSRRTFFNYFASKEDAVLGMREPHLDVSQLRGLAGDTGDGTPAFERTVRVLVHILDDVFPVKGSPERRRALIALEPSLKACFLTHIGAAETLVLEHLASREASGERSAALGAGMSHAQAKALLMLASTIVRYAVTSDPDGMLADRELALQRAAATFREVIEQTL